MYCAKTAETIDMPLGCLARLGPRNYILDGGEGRMNPFVAKRGDMLVM